VEGQQLEDMFHTTPEKIKTMVAQLKLTADSLGLPFGERTRTYNSRLAQELGLWAEDQGRGDEFHFAAFRGYFADGLNLALETVLLGLASEAGLDVKEAKNVIRERRYQDKVDQDWEDSRFKGVTAVPTFIMGQHKLVGAQSYEALEELITLYGTTPKKPVDNE
jgi:predicted DsbA family dithiol-disulfide isomerase